MKKIIFFDTTWNQILRVGNLISKSMENTEGIIKYGLVFETSENEINYKKDEHFFDDVCITRNINIVKNYIEEKRPDVVVFAQNTIPDQFAILCAHKIDAKIVMLQHGLLYDGATLNNVRMGEIFAALMKAKKTFTYFSILNKMCAIEGKSFFGIIIDILIKKYNVTTTIQNYFMPPLRGDYAFVIGEHWVSYYCNNYGYDPKNVFIMGNHDVDDLDDNKTIEEAICYIPSVHVEDGKVMENVFIDFLQKLKDSLPLGKKFYIKLHPRSNKELYDKVFKNSDVHYIQKGSLPYVKVYVGHNSSLLSKALQISGTIILWGFKEEPELFYRDFAYAVCNDRDSLSKVLTDIFSCDYSRKKDVIKYSYKNPVGAYNYCAMKILDF